MTEPHRNPNPETQFEEYYGDTYENLQADIKAGAQEVVDALFSPLTQAVTRRAHEVFEAPKDQQQATLERIYEEEKARLETTNPHDQDTSW